MRDTPSDPADPADLPDTGTEQPGHDPAVQPGAGPSRGLVLGLLAVGVAVVIGATVLLGGGDDGDGAVAGACQPSGAQPLAEGLQPDPGPDTLPPGSVCVFNGDEGIDVATWLGGEPLIVNFWASWCAPCVAEMPDLEAIHLAADGDLRMIGINTQDSPPLAEDLLGETGITYEVVSDPQGDYFAAVEGFGMPTTLFVAPDGRIVFRQTGPLTLAQLAELSATHLGVELDV